MYRTYWHDRVLTGAFHPKLPDLPAEASSWLHKRIPKAPWTFFYKVPYLCTFLLPLYSIFSSHGCLCLCMFKYVHAYACQSQRTILAVNPRNVICVFWDRVLYWHKTHKFDWLTSKIQGFSHLCLPGSQITSVDHHIYLFKTGSGDWTNNVLFTRQVFLSTELSPFSLCILFLSRINLTTVSIAQHNTNLSLCDIDSSGL